MLLSKCSPGVRRVLSTSCARDLPVQKVTIIGSGLMGSGIAQVSTRPSSETRFRLQVSAQANLDVVLVDKDAQILGKAQQRIQKSLERVAKKKLADKSAEEQQKFVAGVAGKIQLQPDLKQAVSQADLVIEAIVEDLGAKRKLLADIETGIKP